MLKTEEPSAAQPERIRCPACGTDQEVVEARESGRCAICSNPLFATAVASKAREEPEPIALIPKDGSELAAAAAAALRQESSGAPPAVLKELIAADRRLTSLLAFVPLWGPWRLQQSELHTDQEKFRLTLLSVLITLLLIAAIWMLQPSPQEILDATRTRVGADLNALDALVESYVAQHREYPDAAVWQRSAESGDLRFYDPWGRIYRYERKEDGFTIGTYGRDGVEGGYGEDADVFRDFTPRAVPGASPAP